MTRHSAVTGRKPPGPAPGRGCDTCLHLALNDPAGFMLMMDVNSAISFICAQC